MIDFLTAPANLPFAVALLVLFIIAIVEGVGAMFGAGISNILGGLFPDLDMHFDGPDTDSPGAFGRVLSWLRVGQVPILILIIVFLVGFGISGLILQRVLLSTFGFMLPAMIAVIPAFFISLPTVRVFGGLLDKIIPKDETSAVSTASFIGKVAVITLGKAMKNSPAQGKLKDQYGKQHYLMIEPDNAHEVFEQGSQVLIVRQESAVFYAILNDNRIMQDT